MRVGIILAVVMLTAYLLVVLIGRSLDRNLYCFED